MYCPSCGKTLSGPSTCWFCGAVVTAEEPTLAERPPTATIVRPPRVADPAPRRVVAADPFVRPLAISVLAVLHIIAALCLLLMGLGSLLMTGAEDIVTAAVAGLILTGIGVTGLACGIGLWRLKPLGRTLALGFAWVGLLGLPFGTLVSALVLYYLFRPGIKVLFSGLPPDVLTDEDRAEVAAVSRHSTVVIVVIVVLVAVCLLIVLGIVSAIAIPGLMRARSTANEASAVASLRAVSSAQVSFEASCGAGSYAPSLALLGVPPAGGGEQAFVSPDLAADPAVKSGYTITLTPGPAVAGAPVSCNGAPAGTMVETYFVLAAPTGTAGGRYFGVNQEGTVYQSASEMPVTLRGAPPGATPVQ
jgi:type II secretory pathway pseudopilin PulG